MAQHCSEWNTEIELDKVVCRFYANSQCEDGDKCHFPHVPQEGRVLDSACRYFLRNKCHFGKLCALDHVNITEKNGKMVIQIIQQQLSARKRQLESLNAKAREPSSSNTVQRTDLVGEPCGVFTKPASNFKVEEHSSSTTSHCSNLDPCGIFSKARENINLRELYFSNAEQHAGLVGEPCGFFPKSVGNFKVREHFSSITDQQTHFVDKPNGVLTKAVDNFKIKESYSSNAGQHAGLAGETCRAFGDLKIKEFSSLYTDKRADLVGQPCGVSNKPVLSGAASGTTSVYNPGPSKQCVDERCSAISSIQPILKSDDRKMYEAGSTEKYLQVFCRDGSFQTQANMKEKYLQNFSAGEKTLKTPVCDNIANVQHFKKSENAERSLKSLSQQEFRFRSSDSEQYQMVGTVPVEGESKDLRSWEIRKTPVENLSMGRSEEERHPTIGSIKSHQKRKDRMPYIAESRSPTCGSGSTNPKTPMDGLDPHVSVVLYNTRIKPRGETAEEIALLSRFTFLPVDERSRVPLYMRKPTREYVGRQTEDAKKAGKGNKTESAEEAEENNDESKQKKEGKYVYTPSGRRVGKNSSNFPQPN